MSVTIAPRLLARARLRSRYSRVIAAQAAFSSASRQKAFTMLMPLRFSCALLLISASCSWVALLRWWIVRLTRNTPRSRKG